MRATLVLDALRMALEPRRRLYVIGDRAAWSTLPHFATLAASLAVRDFAGTPGAAAGRSPA